MNKYFFLFLLLVFTTSLFAKEIKYHIRGNLKNRSNWAVEYANIGVFKEDKLIAGCSSNIDGQFEIDIDEPGSYEINISHLNYTSVRKIIELTPNNSKYNLNTIFLDKIDNSLSEVVVSGNRKLHEKQAREDVFFISKQMLKNSGSVRDLLIQVPTIHVGFDHSISVEGEGDVLVLVNGRRYYETNPLKLLAPEQIDKVQVNTTPSVDIVNEGFTSVVNIILKKDRNYSLNGNFSYVFPNDMLESTDAALSYYTGRWRFFGGYKLHSQTNNYSISEYRTEIGSNDTIFKQGRNSINPRYREQYYGGADYFIDDYNTLGLAANIKTLHRKEYFNELSLMNIDSLFKTQGLEHQDYNNLQISTFYKNQSKDEKKTLSLDLLYSNFNQNEDQNLEDYYFKTLESIERSEYNKLDRERLKAKFVYDIAIDKNSNLKFGVDYNNENTENYLETSKLIRNIEYDNSTYSGFVDYFAKKGKLSYWLGLAQEYNEREISSIKYNNWCFYPNAGVSYKFTSKLSVKASYEKGVYHPSFYELDPYEYYSDSLNVSVGNPYLKDYYSNNFNLSGQYRFGRSYVKMNLFYQLINDDIASVIRYSDEGVRSNTYDNLSKQKKLGIKLNYSLRPNKYFMLGGTFRGFWNRIEEKEYVAEDYTSEMLTYAYVYLPKDFLVFANYRQNSKVLTYGGEQRGYKAFSYGFSKKFFKKKLEFVVNYLNRSLPYETVSKYQIDNYKSFHKMNVDMKTVLFSVFYNFSTKKKMNKKSRGRIRWEEEGKTDKF